MAGLEYEIKYREMGHKFVVGLDEAGRGPLAGPVVVGAVVLPRDSFIEGINDSKKISEKKREALYETITNEAISYGVGVVSQDKIDDINILNAILENDEIKIANIDMLSTEERNQILYEFNNI